MNNDFKPGDLFNKFQAKKKKAQGKKKHKMMSKPVSSKPASSAYMSRSQMEKHLSNVPKVSGAGWGGEKPMGKMKKGKKKHKHSAKALSGLKKFVSEESKEKKGKKKHKMMCKKSHKHSKMCGK